MTYFLPLGLIAVCTLAPLAHAFVQIDQGRLEPTGRVTDVAIDGGGLFVVDRGPGVPYAYVRFGNFSLNRAGEFADASGRPILGFEPGSPVDEHALIAIDLADRRLAPEGTSRVDTNVNLGPETAFRPRTEFEHTDPVATSAFRTGVRVFDRRGKSLTLRIYFRRASHAAGAWAWFAGVERKALDLAVYGPPFENLGPSERTGRQFVPVQSGTIQFNSAGALEDASNSPLLIRFDTDGDGRPDSPPIETPGNTHGWAFRGSTEQTIDVKFGQPISEGGHGFDGSTQFSIGPNSLSSFVRFMSSNGYAAGRMSSLGIDKSGTLIGVFTNGEVRPLGMIALARFLGEAHLDRVGAREYQATTDSGPPFLGVANDGPFGAIRSGYLEVNEDTPIDRCLAENPLPEDPEGDRETSFDQCPDSPGHAAVDTAGCTQDQFCRRIEVRWRKGRANCRRSDWMNNEPRANRPRDCRVERDSRGRPVACRAEKPKALGPQLLGEHLYRDRGPRQRSDDARRAPLP